MESISGLLIHQPVWFWWALGAILIALEIASTTTYLLWPGIAAFLVGLLELFDPALDGRLAVFLFAILSVAATWAWKRSGFGVPPRADEDGTLNRRGAQYRGRAAVAAEDFSGHRGAVLIDDTRWSALAVDGSEPKRNDSLTVTGSDGTVLEVRMAGK